MMLSNHRFIRLVIILSLTLSIERVPASSLHHVIVLGIGLTMFSVALIGGLIASVYETITGRRRYRRVWAGRMEQMQ